MAQSSRTTSALPHLIILGPQGSGKGTQAALLGKKFGYAVIGMGQLLRERASRSDDFGTQLARTLAKGDQVSDAAMETILSSALADLARDRPLAFDGVPRNLGQVPIFERLLAQHGYQPPILIELKIPRSLALKRIANRMRCDHCNQSVGLISRLVRRIVCPTCGAPLHLRADDRAEAIEVRLNLYYTRTMPVIDYYRQRGRVIEIDGSGSIEQVHDLIIKALGLRSMKNGE